MFISGQTINYEKYNSSLQNMPAPILASQIPNVKIDLPGLISYAHDKGVKVGDLTDEEKNRFLYGETVDSLQQIVQDSIKYNNVLEWNSKEERKICSRGSGGTY